MLIYCDVSFEDSQVRNGKQHPDYIPVNCLVCPICGQKLEGHGWRMRTVTDINKTSSLIWIHRMRCPECRTTFTVLPTWVHPLKLYTLETIEQLLQYRFETGHKCGSSRISRYLQEKWYRSFEAAFRMSGLERCLSNRLEFLESCTAPIGFPFVQTAKERAVLLELKTRLRYAHHRLLLLWDTTTS